MSAGLLLQYGLVALAVVCSAGFVAITRFPAGTRRLRIATAVPLLRKGRATWLQVLGRKIAPTPLVGSNTCGACNGCGGAAPRRHRPPTTLPTRRRAPSEPACGL